MGLEFMPIFKDWAKGYDDEVNGSNLEYRDVFSGYWQILAKIAEEAGDVVVEFGSGTGNLTKELIARGKKVVPVEPSPEMRSIAKNKTELASVDFVDGDLEHFPVPENLDTFVSNLVFHHLSSEEKQRAVKKYYQLLPKGGQVIFGDTMFLSQQTYDKMLENAERQGFTDLAADLKREYYPLMADVDQYFTEAGFTTSYQQMNPFVWIVKATK